MQLKLLIDSDKEQYNKVVTHIMQSWEWGEFRQKMGLTLLRYGLYQNNKLTTAFQITFHKTPLLGKYVGYLPKGPFPNKELAKALTQIAKQQNCLFIKLEPNAILRGSAFSVPRSFAPSPKPLFTKHNYILDLTKSEDELLKSMHSKTRYNIKVAQKHGVKVAERADDEAFKIYLQLYFETTKRQGYHGHNKTYHQTVWQTLKTANMARILLASYKNEPLTAWMLFNFGDTLYYPYGGSSKSHPEVMANNLIAWEAIKLGQKLNLKKFDMWGALGPNANPKDPWYGFHRFKAGYGGELLEYLGTYDLVLDPLSYFLFNIVDKSISLKILLLKLLSK